MIDWVKQRGKWHWVRPDGVACGAHLRPAPFYIVTLNPKRNKRCLRCLLRFRLRRRKVASKYQPTLTIRISKNSACRVVPNVVTYHVSKNTPAAGSVAESFAKADAADVILSLLPHDARGRCT